MTIKKGKTEPTTAYIQIEISGDLLMKIDLVFSKYKILNGKITQKDFYGRLLQNGYENVNNYLEKESSKT